VNQRSVHHLIRSLEATVSDDQISNTIPDIAGFDLPATAADHAPPQPSAARGATARRAEPEPEVSIAEPAMPTMPAKPSGNVVEVADVLARRRAGTRADVLDLLPPLAAERLSNLRTAGEEARAAVRIHSDKLADLRDRRRDAERRLAYVRNYPGTRLREDDPQVISLKTEIAETAAKIPQTDALMRERSERAGAISTLGHRVEAWLSGLPSDTVLSDVEVLEPKLGKGETAIDAIERCRRRVRELAADRRAVMAAPVPSAEAKRRVRDEVDRIAAAGEIDVSGSIEGGDVLRWPTSTHHVPITGAGVGSLVQVDTPAVMAWLFRDQLIARLEAEVDLVADDQHALDDATRAAKLAEIELDLLATQREECALIEAAARTGLTIPHRSDVAVEALLGVRVEHGTDDNAN
jgi:hypothetical protein